MPDNASLNEKLLDVFPGKVVRKDLTKLLKGGQNVPAYVLEYLLGQYCSTGDEGIIEEGFRRVKEILSSNYVRPDEAEKIKSKIRELGYYTIIDKVTVRLNEKRDIYEAEFSNLGIKGSEVESHYVKDYEKLLGGGIWCIVKVEYNTDNSYSPFVITGIKPIQIPKVDVNEIIDKRTLFTLDEWMDLMLRSIGMEPTTLKEKEKWHLIERLVPLAENNYNLCELGPRSTGKSHIYKEVSPNSILVSGGQTTVANLFYNMANRQIGLVGLWDVVAFDEVAGIHFKDKDGVQILKDYMASGSFARGKEYKQATAAIVMVGNINQSVASLLKSSHLFAPFPEAMNNDTAFFDRIHYYLPGWEVPKFRPTHFTNEYGFIVDYLAEFLREMRKKSYADLYTPYFKLGSNLNQRDVIAVNKTVSGLLKILFPDGQVSKEEIAHVLEYALEGRRRVKEQLKRIGGMEFYDVNFSYLDKDTMEEHYVSLSESGGAKLIPEGMLKPGQVFVVGAVDDGKIGIYKIELQIMAGTGKFERTGVGSSSATKESINTAINYFRAHAKTISQSVSVKDHDFFLHVQDLYGIGVTEDIALACFVSFCSGALDKPLQEQMAVIGTMTIGGSLKCPENLADILQVSLDAGAKRVLIPNTAVNKFNSVPPELLSKFQISFYQDPIDAVNKSLGF